MIAGLDIGTTGCKIVVFDLKGNELYCAYRRYETVRANGEKEIDPLLLLKYVKEIIKEATDKYSISSIGIDSFGEAIVLLDKDDNPLTNFILGGDVRGASEVEDLIKILGRKEIGEISGLNPDYTCSIFKTMWLKKNRPEIYNRAARIMLVEDYVIYMLTGEAVIEYSLASRTCALDINKLEWSKEIFNAAGVDINLFSEAVPLLSKSIEIKDSIRKELNITEKVFVTPTGLDQVPVAIGCGVNNTAVACDGCGTVQCVTCVFEKPSNYSEFLKNYMGIAPFFDKYSTFAYSFCGCSLVDWFINNFVPNMDKTCVFEQLEKEFKNGPTGLLVMPHFAGASVPYMDPESKGIVYGLSLENSLSEMYKSVLEGIAYEMKVNLSILKKNGIKPRILYATGGGSASNKWLQIKADILNLPIKKVKGKESGCRGSAILAGVTQGLYKSIEEGTKLFVKYGSIIKPNKENVLLYKTQFNKYRKLYNFGKTLNKIN